VTHFHSISVPKRRAGGLDSLGRSQARSLALRLKEAEAAAEANPDA
jgi:hypothetical protein